MREAWAQVVRTGHGRVVFAAKPTATAGCGLFATVAAHLPAPATPSGQRQAEPPGTSSVVIAADSPTPSLPFVLSPTH